VTKVNKILVLFLVFVSGATWLFWQVLHSPRVVSIISEKVSSQVKSQIGVDFSFDQVELRAFPPGVRLLGVKYKGDFSDGVSISGLNSEVSFYFNIFDLFLNKVTLEDVSIEDGILSAEGVLPSGLLQNGSLDFDYFSKSKSGGENEITYKYVRSLIKENLPISIYNISLKKMTLLSAGAEISIEHLSSSLMKKSISLNMGIRNIPHMRIGGSHFNQLDGIELEGSWNKDDIFVDRAKILSGLSSIELKGNLKGDLSKKDQLTHFLDGVGVIDIEEHSILSTLSKDYNADGGLLTFEVKSSDEVVDPNIQLKVNIKEFESSVINADNLSINVAKNEDVLIVNKIRIEKDDSRVSLKDSVKIFDFKTNSILTNPFRAILKDYRTNDLLKYVNQLDPLKTRISGEAEIKIIDKIIFIESVGDVIANNLKLQFSEGGKSVFDVPQIVIKEIKLDLDIFENYLVAINATGEIGGQKIVAVGSIEEDLVSFKSTGAQVDFSKTGPIVGLDLKGKGVLDFSIEGDQDNLMIDLDGRLKDTNILGFNLGSISGKFSIDVAGDLFAIRDLQGELGQSRYSLWGEINYQEEVELDITADFSTGTYNDSLVIYSNLLENLSYKPKNLNVYYSTRYKITGPADPIKVNVDGSMRTSSISWYGEDFDSLNAGFSYHNGVLDFKKIVLRKDSGRLKGNYSYDIKSELMAYKFNWRGVRPKDYMFYNTLPLGFDGSISGQSEGGGKIGKLKTDSKFYISRGHVGGFRVGNSVAKVSSLNSIYTFDGTFFDKRISFNSRLDWNESKHSKARNSYLKSTIDFDNLKTLMGMVSYHNIHDSAIKGELKGKIDSKFNFNNLSSLDLNLQVDEFSFHRLNFGIKFDQPQSIVVEKGVIKKWDLKSNQSVNRISSKGAGELGKNFTVDNKFRFDASILETFHPKLIRVKGIVNGGSKLTGDKEDLTWSGVTSGDDISINFEGLPAYAGPLAITTSLLNDKILIEKAEGVFGGGDIEAFGSILLKFPFPDFNINFGIKNSKLAFFKKSEFVVSGRGSLIGSTIPYTLGGNFVVDSASIEDEIEDFAEDDEGSVKNTRFRPKVKKLQTKEIFEYKMKVSSNNTIRVKNSLSDIIFGGSGSVVGTMNNPKLDAIFSVYSPKSKFHFKQNDFQLSKGEVQFFGKEEEVNPKIYFSGDSRIADYKVRVEISGRAKDFNMVLTSDPSLSQRDIVSLLAFGYTGSLSQDLTESDRNSLSSSGLGSILFDKFKFNENLKSSLGLKVSIAPEFSEDEGNMIKGRIGSSSESASYRYRSATKVKLQRKLGKSIDLSVSSTVGGSLAAQQEMNLNYRLNNHVSLQGVYELKEEGGDGDNVQNSSYGADLKLRWTFK
jgi:translocation and assembly module TamB